jgi:release factor glutamine methyltransferase
MVARRVLAALRTRIARPLVHRVRRPYVLSAIAKASEVHLLGYRIRTDPNVFHPGYFSSSLILATQIRELDLRGRRFLDMGTGTGLSAIAAAARGALVTACDLNPRAVALARQNADVNGVPVEVLESDLFAVLEGRRFDLISFNVPFYARAPENPIEAAFYAGPNLETIHRFAEGCQAHLEANGRVVIIFSEESGVDRVLLAFTERGLSRERVEVTRRLLEDFYTAWFRVKSDDGARRAPW